MKRERDPMNVSEFHLIDWMGLRVQKRDLAWWLRAFLPTFLSSRSLSLSLTPPPSHHAWFDHTLLTMME